MKRPYGLIGDRTPSSSGPSLKVTPRRVDASAEAAPEDRLASRKPSGKAADPDQDKDAEYLQRAAGHEQAAVGPQVREREFDSDREEQQHHPDLGQHLDLLDVRDEIESVGPDQGPGRQEPGNGGHAELVEEKDDRDGHGEDDQQVAQDIVVGHGRLALIRTSIVKHYTRFPVGQKFAA